MITEGTLTDNGRLNEVPMYSPTQCEDIAEKLWQNKNDWTQRGPAFFTLGATTYIDVCAPNGSIDKYRRLFSITNDVIERNFNALLDDIKTTISNATGVTCEYSQELAYPGFHIFLGPSLTTRLRDNFHLDLQYTRLGLDTDIYTPTLTFTLPIKLPKNGAGIEFCFDKVGDHKGEVKVVGYTPGKLLIHSGRILHRRAHFPADDNCCRITLQGHGILVDGKWILYW